MSEVLLIILVMLCVCTIANALVRYDGMLQFPFLITLDILFFLCPQLLYLTKNPELYEVYDPAALSLFLGVVIAFYLAAVLGYSRRPWNVKWPSLSFRDGRLAAGLYVLALISMYGKYKLSNLPIEMKAATQWTGLAVRYHFFSLVGTLCIPLGIILFFKNRRKIVLVPLVFEVVSTIALIIRGGRRSPVVFLGLMVLAGLWFSRRIRIPRLALAAGGLVFFMFVMNIGIYRSLVNEDYENKWQIIANEVFDIKKTMAKFTKSESSNTASSYVDALNGVMAVSASNDAFHYDCGVILWNQLIFRWVPGQLVGHGVKRALMLDVSDSTELLKTHYQYKVPVGTCIPGYAEMFASFGLLGIFVMYLIGRFSRTIWEFAMSGELVAQIAHFALSTVYIRFGGGGIWPLISGLGFWVVFLLPIFFWARRPAETQYVLEEFDDASPSI